MLAVLCLFIVTQNARRPIISSIKVEAPLFIHDNEERADRLRKAGRPGSDGRPMADLRRFEIFAQFIAERFPGARRIYDIAGGMGRLNEELTRLGREVTTFDERHKRLKVRYQERRFTLEEPCHCDAIVGLHPDGATRIIIEYAAAHRVPFASPPTPLQQVERGDS